MESKHYVYWLLTTLVILICTSGADSKPQVLHCHYFNEEGYETGNGFGGHFHDYGNGSARCTLDSSDKELSCMAVFQLTQDVDSSGNMTERLVIRSTGCWSDSWNSLSDCNNGSKCVGSVSESNSLGFCCCTQNNCNSNATIQNVLPPVVETSPLPTVEPPNAVTAYILPFVFTMVILVVLVVVIFYICRKRRMQKAELKLKMKQQYDYEMRLCIDEPPTVSYDDLKLEVCLHKGRFGDVYKAKMNDEDVCVKYFHSQQKSLFTNERDIYSVLDPSVRSIVSTLTCDERVYRDGTVQYIVIMEYISMGSLSAYLKCHTISGKELCSLGQSAAAGLGYLHSETYINGCHKHAIVHRDINSRNILVRPDMTCAIADMGFAMKIRGSKIIRNGVEELAEDGSLRDVGTVRYMAPEILDCAVNLKDCESSLKQIDVYALSLVIWELLSRCRDLLYEKGDSELKRFMLPFEEDLGSHPDFERMRIHVAKEHKRPEFPINLKKSEASRVLKDTIEECWDTDAEARLTSLCVAERFKQLESLMEAKVPPTLAKNEVSDKHKLGHDLIPMEPHELSPLIEQDTPASDGDGTPAMAGDSLKADVNVEMERDRQMAPLCGRNVVTERNTCHRRSDDDLAVHDNTLMPMEEAKARQAAEEERSKRQWEESQLYTHQSEPARAQRVSRPPTRTVQLDVHNDVRDPNKVKENNLNRRRHNSQHNLNESSTSSNGGAGSMVTVPAIADRRNRPKSLNLNIQPERS